MAQIRTVEGNARCEVYLKVADGIEENDKLIVLEVWKNIAAHKNATSAIDLNSSRGMALLSERPSGQYYAATES